MTSERRSAWLIVIAIIAVVVLFLMIDAWGASRHMQGGTDTYTRSDSGLLDVWYRGLDSIVVAWVKTFEVTTEYRYDPITLELLEIVSDTTVTSFTADTTYYDN